MVSVLGLGTVKLGRNRGLKLAGSFELPDDAAAHALLDAAAESGVNLLDTAPAYGVAERRLGTLLAQRGDRDRWVIVTKAGEEFDGERSRFDFSAGAVTASVERSLSSLGVERLAAVLLHSDGDDRAVIEESGGLAALERLRARGDVGLVGVSTKTVEGAMLAAQRCGVVMLTAHPGHVEEEPAAAAAGERGAAVLVKKPVRSGRSADPAGDIAYAATRRGVTSVVVGTINPEHLRANARAASAAAAAQAGA